MTERLLVRTREIVGSKAFNIEYLHDLADQELFYQIISYLGEYRLRVEKYRYPLEFSGDSFTNLALRDGRSWEPMKDKARRAIYERRKRGDPTYREKAELYAMEGPGKLEDQLRFSQDGDSIIWMSPPGPREEGYGDYGFVYVGQIRRTNELKKEIAMVAIRVEKPTLQNFNAALSKLLHKNTHYETADDFLRSPQVVRRLTEQEVDRVLHGSFPVRGDHESETMFHAIVHRLRPAIEDFIHLVKTGTREEKLQALFSLENYALTLKERYRREVEEKVICVEDYRAHRLAELLPLYSYQPPVVSGNCGSTQRASSNAILHNGYEELMEALLGQDWFTCPNCNYKADGPVGNKCPSCGITKEDYAKETGAPVCA